MRRIALTIPLMLGGLAAPAIAQGLPALEGNGSQTQSLELGQGAVSVTLESSGAISAGRGSDAVDGQAVLTVNDQSIGIGNARGTQGASGNAEPESSGGRTAGVTAGPSGDITSTSAAPQPQDDTVCALPLATPADLADALKRQYRVIAMEAHCASVTPELDALLASSADFRAALEAIGAPSSGLVSITIDNGAVILGYAAAR